MLAGAILVAMASANVELVRSIYADWERGDFSSAVWADSEIEFVAADGPSPGRRTGVAGMEEAWRDFLTAWGDYRSSSRGERRSSRSVEARSSSMWCGGTAIAPSPISASRRGAI
jgi:hypothetical protein